MKSKHTLSKIFLIVWLVFSVLYVAWGEWSRFRVFVMNNSYNAGMRDAVVQVIQQAQECKAFPVNVGEQGVQLVNVECLKGSSEVTVE